MQRPSYVGAALLYMKIYTITREQVIPKPVDEVFSFFSRPENLGRLTPRNLGFQILTPSPVRMKEGALIDYKINLLGFPVRWRSMISLYDPPRTFVDEQLGGPYSFWHHTHEFVKAGQGTLVRDRVLYVMPFGFLGDLLQKFLVRRKLDRIFQYRSQLMEEIFSSGKLYSLFDETILDK